MANQEHLDILRQGGMKWNQWRRKYPDIKPNLIGAKLSGAFLTHTNLINVDLSGSDLSRSDLGNARLNGAHLISANLSQADLHSVRLVEANLTDANLKGAMLSGADLSRTNLMNADLSRAVLFSTNLSDASLRGANLSTAYPLRADFYRADLSDANLDSAIFIGANLRQANLTRANLRFANLTGTDLSEANLSGALLSWTAFGDVDLRSVKGLETVRHASSSQIDLLTLSHSQGNIPEVFLKGAGIPDTFIDYISSFVGKPIEFYSCFISYSSKDEGFAERLYADLQSKGVRCWFAPHDMRIGDKIRPRIDESIRLYDKLLLVLTQHSVDSTWVCKRQEDSEPSAVAKLSHLHTI